MVLLILLPIATEIHDASEKTIHGTSADHSIQAKVVYIGAGIGGGIVIAVAGCDDSLGACVLEEVQKDSKKVILPVLLPPISYISYIIIVLQSWLEPSTTVSF